MLLTLIRNEFRKLVRRPKTWIVFALFTAFVGLCIFGTYKSDESMRYYISPQFQIENGKQHLSHINSEINRINELSEDKKAARELDLQNLIQEKAQVEEEIKKNEEIIAKGSTETDWKAELDTQIENAKTTIYHLENEQGIDEGNQGYYLKTKQNLEYFEYLKANNIQPLYGWEYEAYGFMDNLMEILGMAILVAGISVFMSDIVSGECTPATLKFLLVQPVKRGKVLVSKFISVTATVVAMILSLEAIGFAIVTFTSKIKHSADLPVVIGKVYESTVNAKGFTELVEKAGTGVMVSNTEMLMKALLLQTLFIVTTCAVVFMISSIIKSSMVTMGISVLSLVFATILSLILSPVKKIAHLLFVNYGSSISLLKGDLPTMYSNVNVTASTGIVVMVATIIISYVIAHLVFTKRDILI